ncbi:MAG: RIP metalloprotease [Desulfovibrio sp.]|jgi:regulator of sigma E protease|nr:RIP metalloprotease [Desulfovibrio sp.]
MAEGMGIAGVAAVVLVFGGLIMFHELGHFIAARAMGIGVKTFSLGFGPVLFSFARGKTIWQLAALPLGGFVSLVGETDSAEIPEGFSEKESFALRPARERFMVIAAGPLFNLVLAWLICWGILYVNGRNFVPPVVGGIIEGGAAASSPLRVGDRIMSIDGTAVRRWLDIAPLVRQTDGRDVVVTAQRPDGSSVVFSLAPRPLPAAETDGKGAARRLGLGIRAAGETEHEELSFLQSLPGGLTEAGNMAAYTWNALVDIVSRRVAFDNVGGPILIAQAIYKQADRGAADVLMLAALISVNLGILNLLPIPVLDGGHLLFLSAEMATRRKVPEHIREKAVLAGLALLIALVGAATFNDLTR